MSENTKRSFLETIHKEDTSAAKFKVPKNNCKMMQSANCSPRSGVDKVMGAMLAPIEKVELERDLHGLWNYLLGEARS